MTKSYREQLVPPSRLLCGPGPSNVPASVLNALARPTLGHLDPAFIEFMDKLKNQLRWIFQTANRMTIPVSGPGSAAMEMAVVNMVEPEDQVAVCHNGVFGNRFKAMIERAGGQPVIIEHEWGEPASPDKLNDCLAANPNIKLVCFVHAETSTGALSDAAEISKVAKKHGAMLIMDAVTSLGGVPVEVDGWGIDVCYSGSQKCLSCPPGIAPITFSDQAISHIQNRKTAVRSWFFDITELNRYWGDGARSYHHTAPVNMLYALSEAVAIIQTDGLSETWARHLSIHQLLVKGLNALGLSLLVEEGARIPQLNAVKVPDEGNEAQVRGRLMHDYNIEIGAGLGPLAGKVWRIGMMGASCEQRHAVYLLAALSEVLR